MLPVALHASEASQASQARPFLKWAGGKRQLLPELRRFYPRAFGTYFEPFLGSGAVFFDLYASGLLVDRPAILTDTNPDVVGCYLAVRNDVDQVIGHLEALAAGHSRAGADHYYEVRESRFNPWRQRLFAEPRGDQGLPPYPAELAAMLIYLNRTGYNGLFRLNRRGAFNVPAPPTAGVLSTKSVTQPYDPSSLRRATRTAP